MKFFFPLCLLLSGMVATTISCKSSRSATDTAEALDSARICRVSFDADSAFAFAKAQCEFGFRTPNSVALEKCGNYIVGKFRQFGLEVNEQRTTVKAWNGKSSKCRNIIATYQPEAKERIVLAAHYDARPWAEQDADSTLHHQPVMAADDGASGVAVLLEVARKLKELRPAIGIDFICFDAEDYGAPYWAPEQVRNDESTFCLGSQYWSAHPLRSDYAPRYGILLDMVGGRGNRFYYEGFSMKYAQAVAVRVWDAAKYAGAEEYFIQENGGFITDDHLPMNNIGGIPTIDVIAFSPDDGFPKHWHTTHDTMDNIDPATLKAVGQTMLQVISEEK